MSATTEHSDNSWYFIDLSSNNTLPRFKRRWLKKLWNAGYRTIGLKATEGLDYTWETAEQFADIWHTLGGNVWHYHFGRPANPTSQAGRFIGIVRRYFKPGDRIVIDVEDPALTNAWTRAFIISCHHLQPRWPGLVYSYASFLTARRIRPVHGWGLWLAAYQHDKPKPVAGWKYLDAWQQTDAAHVVGMSGHVDRSRILEAVVHWQATRTVAPSGPEPAATASVAKTKAALAAGLFKYAKAHVALVGALLVWATHNLHGQLAHDASLALALLTAAGVYKVKNRST